MRIDSFSGSNTKLEEFTVGITAPYPFIAITISCSLQCPTPYREVVIITLLYLTRTVTSLSPCVQFHLPKRKWPHPLSHNLLGDPDYLDLIAPGISVLAWRPFCLNI
jgi:hypothetical protein